LFHRALDLLRSMRARRPAAVMILAIVALGSAPLTLAKGIDPSTLNPVPASFYTCRATGSGAICNGHTVTPYEFEATGIFCGSGAGTVELLDSGIRDIQATRWYDTSLNLVRRQRMFLFRDAHLTNPATGQTLYYSQHNADNELLGVPGDLATATLHSSGHLTMTTPRFGTVILSAGHVVIGPDGDLEFQAGPSEFDDYLGGQADLADDLCAALGTPNIG
jgi:hypothetical protein